MTDIIEKKPRNIKTANSTATKDKNQQLKDLIVQIMNNKTEGVVTYEDGKTYTKVDYRLRELRKLFGYDVSIISHIIERTSQEVCVETTIQLYIEGRGWTVVSNGLSHETRDKSVMHNTSYVEIAETSAIGRALANLGLFGNEYASVNEIESANKTANSNSNKDKTIKSASTKKINAQQIAKIREYLQNNKEVKESTLLADYKKDKIENLMFEDAESILQKISYLEDSAVL